MDRAALIPQPGELLGWVILFGERLQFRAFVSAEDGKTAADLKAAKVHGVIVAAVGGDFSPKLAQK